MPINNIDARKAIAEIAAKHGWIAQVRDVNEGVVLYRVTYIHPDSDARIMAEYNKIDKLIRGMVSLKKGDIEEIVRQAGKVKEWMHDLGSPESTIKHGSGKAELWRDGKLIASAERMPGAQHWMVYSEPLKTNIAMLGANGAPENVTRKLVLAVLKEL